jgi:hypothetical protein
LEIEVLERRAHQVLPDVIILKMTGTANGYFNFAERLKDWWIIFAAQENGVNPRGDNWMQLALTVGNKPAWRY